MLSGNQSRLLVLLLLLLLLLLGIGAAGGSCECGKEPPVRQNAGNILTS